MGLEILQQKETVSLKRKRGYGFTVCTSIPRWTYAAESVLAIF